MSEQSSTPRRPILAIIGGTGKEGKGLAYQWAKSGYNVIIGSRQREKAEAAAETIRSRPGVIGMVFGKTNPEAAAEGEIITVTVPYEAHRATLESISPFVQGKIVIDTTVPLVPPRVTRVQLPPAGSASLESQIILGEAVNVVTAFQNVSYEKLWNDLPANCDVLVCGKGKEARTRVLELVEAAGLTGWDAGPLENSVVPEALTSILISLNKQYGVQSSGIKITGIER